MSAVQAAPSGERSQGRGRYGVVSRGNPVWSIPERLEVKFHERRYTSTLYLTLYAALAANPTAHRTYAVCQKKVPPNSWRQLRQISTDFQNSFTAGKRRNFPINWLVFVLQHHMSMGLRQQCWLLSRDVLNDFRFKDKDSWSEDNPRTTTLLWMSTPLPHQVHLSRHDRSLN